MSEAEVPPAEPITEEDAASGFRCGVHALDDYFARHAVPNDRAGVSKALVLRRSRSSPQDPPVLGFYTVSMAVLASEAATEVLKTRLPRYPLPVALIGRLAVHEASRGRGHGEALLIDALRRVFALSKQIGCLGVVADAKDEGALRFYAKYGFVAVETAKWPRRMFMPLATLRIAISR